MFQQDDGAAHTTNTSTATHFWEQRTTCPLWSTHQAVWCHLTIFYAKVWKTINIQNESTRTEDRLKQITKCSALVISRPEIQSFIICSPRIRHMWGHFLYLLHQILPSYITIHTAWAGLQILQAGSIFSWAFCRLSLIQCLPYKDISIMNPFLW